MEGERVEFGIVGADQLVKNRVAKMEEESIRIIFGTETREGRETIKVKE